MGAYHRDSYRFLFMNYLFYNGIIPTRALWFMGATTRGIQKQVRLMKEEGWIKCENNFGMKYYVISSRTFAYREYQDRYFEACEEHYLKRKKSFYRSESASENAISNKQKMQRLEMISESSIFLAEAGISIFPFEKPDLNSKSINFNHPVFYQSIEIKDVMEDEEARSMASRMTGCICLENEIWPVYALSDGVIKIGDITEKLMIERLNIFFSSRREQMKVEDTFLFTWEYEKVHEKLSLKSNFGSFFYLNDNYRRYYLIPYGREGKRLTSLIMKKYAIEELMNMIVRDTWRIDKSSTLIDADGIDENGVYIFNYLVPDICRMKKFIKSAVALKDKNFHVFCYEFQEEALKKELPFNVTYSIYDFDTVEELCIKRIERRLLNE